MCRTLILLENLIHKHESRHKPGRRDGVVGQSLGFGWGDPDVGPGPTPTIPHRTPVGMK